MSISSVWQRRTRNFRVWILAVKSFRSSNCPIYFYAQRARHSENEILIIYLPNITTAIHRIGRADNLEIYLEKIGKKTVCRRLTCREKLIDFRSLLVLHLSFVFLLEEHVLTLPSFLLLCVSPRQQELLSLDKTRNMSLNLDLKKSRSQIRKEKLKGKCSLMWQLITRAPSSRFSTDCNY